LAANGTFASLWCLFRIATRFLDPPEREREREREREITSVS
jgi:hypothetical protein